MTAFMSCPRPLVRRLVSQIGVLGDAADGDIADGEPIGPVRAGERSRSAPGDGELAGSRVWVAAAPELLLRSVFVGVGEDPLLTAARVRADARGCGVGGTLAARWLA